MQNINYATQKVLMWKKSPQFSEYRKMGGVRITIDIMNESDVVIVDKVCKQQYMIDVVSMLP